jgi:hypothetical protein
MESMVKVIERAEIPPEELVCILKQGAILRLPYLEGRVLQAREHTKRLYEKYGITLDTLQSQGLPEDANYEMHEDFITWEYWDDVLRETETALQSIKALLEKLEGAVDLH